MTSGQFHTIDPSSVIVLREERQRRVLDRNYIENELAPSIATRGLIHPPVLTREHVLVVGECRTEACKFLGWTAMPFQYTDEVDPIELEAIELEENIRRKSIEWKEECLAVSKFHSSKSSVDPTWTQDRTAEFINMTQQAVSQRLDVARELLNGNTLVAAAPKFSTARGIVQRAAERRAQSATLDIAALAGAPSAVAEVPIFNADFLEWAPRYEGRPFNFIHCDFPYGINADKFNQGAAPSHGGYDDSEATYWNLIDCLLANLDLFAAESCHFMFWFSMHYYQRTLDRFAAANIFLDPFPLIWMKSDNVGILPDPSRGPRRLYETAFFGARGDRKVVRSTGNAIALPSERDAHMSIKPLAVLQHFFQMFCDSSTYLLDPTCGSGSAVRAVEGLGGRGIGLERDSEFCDRAKQLYRLNKGAKS